MVTAPVSKPGDWTELIAGDDRHYIQSVTTFENLLVVEERVDGLSQIRLRDYASGAERYIAFPEASFVAALSHNPEYRVDRLRIGYESMVTPNTVYDYHIADDRLETLKVREIPSGYDASKYANERLMAPSRDGTLIPVSVVYRRDFVKDGSGPLHIQGYGAYGYAYPPGFSANRLSLLDRGFACAIAHIRGGDDLGYRWYLDGKLEKRTNTFNDFVDVTRFLIAQGFAHFYVPVGTCSAVLVRWRTSHFDFPASASVLARMIRRPGRRPAEHQRDALGVIGDGALVVLPGGERRRHVVLAVEIDRKRQRVHHGAAAALPDVRRDRVRGVADHRDLARRPALELDVFEAVVAARRADAADQRFEMRKPALPGLAVDRDFLRRLVAVEHGQRDIDLGLAARRVEHAPAAGPVFDRGGAVGRPSPPASCRSGAACSRRPDICAWRAGPRPSRSCELVPSAATIRSALIVCAVGQGQLAVRRGRHAFRIEHDLGAGQRRGFAPAH